MFNNLKQIITLIKKYGFSILHYNKVNIVRMSFPKAFIHSNVIINYEYKEQIILGNNTLISNFCTLVVANDPHNNLDNSKLIIGSNTYIGEYNNIRAGGGIIKIGNNCSISQHITIIASNHQFLKGILIQNQPWETNNNYVIIEDNVWIGANSVILPGVKIYQGAIIGAGSIVTKDIPQNAIAVGNPAKVIKFRD